MVDWLLGSWMWWWYQGRIRGECVHSKTKYPFYTHRPMWRHIFSDTTTTTTTAAAMPRWCWRRQRRRWWRHNRPGGAGAVEAVGAPRRKDKRQLRPLYTNRLLPSLHFPTLHLNLSPPSTPQPHLTRRRRPPLSSSFRWSRMGEKCMHL